jgi:hypothetical protein
MIEKPEVGMQVRINNANGSSVCIGDVCEVIELDIFSCGEGQDNAFRVIDKNEDKWVFMPSMATEIKESKISK